MKIIDTTLLIGHARGDDAVETYLTEHATETLIVPTIAFQELAVGEVAARDETKEETLSYLGAFDVRAFDSDHAYHAAVIETDLRRKGEYDSRLARDVLIGGVARSLSRPVVTRNTDHFSKFDGVSVETY